MSLLRRGEPAAPAAAREESIPLPRPEKAGSETAILSILCLVAAVAVFQFFAGMASFAERAPNLADRFGTFRPEFVEHLYAAHPPITNAAPVQPSSAPATAIVSPAPTGRAPS
ncbi:MAG: hypothetical protein IT581_15810 [Verrucomicrobiales bacterium]|nr:hypothetical protein [Verrucomicrobiales bacterium]